MKTIYTPVSIVTSTLEKLKFITNYTTLGSQSGEITLRNYDITAPDIVLIAGDSVNGENGLYFGGGDPAKGVVTAIYFYTTTTTTDTLGDCRYSISKEGNHNFYSGTMTIGGNIILPTVTGVKIGTATNQLLGFYNVAPVDQPATVSDAVTQDLAGADTIDHAKVEADLTSCKNAINAIIDRLQELGLIA